MNSKFTQCMATLCILLGSLVLGTGCFVDEEALKEKIESITFDKERVTLSIDEEATVKVTAKPGDAKRNEKIKYTSTNAGIVAISETTNDGFIVKGINSGSTVIVAKSENVTSYLEVIVDNNSIVRQYINIPTPVIEVNEGERRTAQVSLYGGTILDNNNFKWKVEEGKNNISIEATQNLVVVNGEKRGYQKIIVSHEKSEFDNEILVFVKGVDEAIKYITSDTNVMVVPIDGQYHSMSVRLANGADIDNNNFVFEVENGHENIEVIPNRNVINIKGEKPGISGIKVSHPLAEIDFYIRVLSLEVAIPFIMVDQTFAILNVGEYITIQAIVENPLSPGRVDNDFSYTVLESDDNVIETIQTNNRWWIRANKTGNARIIISNAQTELSREVLVIVRDDAAYDHYITTSQNVIMTQVGAADTLLNIQLVNGNEADANGFEWVVDDSSIIMVESGNGSVRHTRSVINSVFNGTAVITPKKAGTAKITISHYKSETSLSVMVKVYPKGTFALMALNVGGEGLHKVVKGTPLPVNLQVTEGNAGNVGSLDWSTRDADIAGVDTSFHGLSNVLTGISTGLTKMIVNGDGLEYPYESLVMAGTQEELDMMSVIYVDTIYQKMVTEQVVYITVKDSQDRYINSNDFKVEVEEKNIVYAVMVKNQLILQGKEVGETKVMVTHPLAINRSITINIRVDPEHINIDKPFHLSGPDIIGVVRNIDTETSVKLVGASVIDAGNITWKVDDTSVLEIMGNGESVIIRGKTSETQTKIRASHPKSENEKIILVYVTENEADLHNRIAIGLKSENYLLTNGENILVSLITNASESQKLGLQWNIKYGVDVISVDPNYDSAMVRAIGAGNAEIEVRHPQNIIPASIYVSVVDALSDEKVIKGPAVIELLTGESKIVQVSHKNLSQIELGNIRWDIENKNVANIRENGDSAYLLGLEKGVSYVNIKQDGLGYRHRATLVCANTQEELESLYIMGVQDTYYAMNIGDEKKIRLEFGSAGFPETAKSQIRWEASGNGAVRVAGSGESATVIADKEGIGKVTITSEASFNSTLELTFEVWGNKIGQYEFKGHEKILGLVVGQSAQIAMHLYEGSREITNGYSLLDYENDNDNVITISTIDNIINITAISAGQSYITVKHNQVNDPARILVYTANSQAELDSYYPISVDKTNYLIQVGESVSIRLNTIESKDTQNNLADIQWGIENSAVIESPQFFGKKEAVVKGKFAGQCVININFKGKVVEKVYIAVVENSTIDASKNMVTESIIGMVKGETRETVIQTNLLESEAGTLVWESSNENLITVSGNGRRAVITANSTIPANNEAYVTVSYGSWLKRHILVYVCNDELEMQQYKAMNIENQYYRLGRNETIIVPIYYAPNKPTADTVWTDRYGNNVVEFSAKDNGGKIEITSLNEGVAVLEAANVGRNNNQNPVRIYVEVSNKYTNAPKTPELKYLTTAKTLYVLNPDEPDIYADIAVTGIGMLASEMNNLKWHIASGSEYIKIYPNGQQCRVLPNRGEGEAIINVSHADNILEIKVIVTRNPEIRDIAYIAADDVVRIGSGEDRTITLNVQNGGNYDKSAFKMEVVSGRSVVDAGITGNMLSLTGLQSGQALIRVSCKPYCQFDKEIVVIVTTTPDGVLYLTTKDNFTVVKRNEYTTISVDMVGFEDKGQGYVWTVDAEDEDLIAINASGRQAQVLGRAIGTAKITVWNTLVHPDFKLSLYVRVTEMDITPVYITTPKNIISTIEGTSLYIQAELVNGKPEESSFFSWINFDTDIVQTEGYGSQIIVMAKKPGMAKIRIDHPSSSNKIDVIVIVEKDRSNENIYITTDSNLIEMRPNETRKLSVRLIGGNPEDIYGFKWDIIDYRSVENVPGSNVSKEVVRLVSSADSAYVTGINEGEATVEVSHPKTNYKLTFKVDVYLYSKINFTQKSITINMGESKTIAVEAPTGTKVVYTAAGEGGKKVVDVYGTNKVCIITALEEGIAIIGATNPQGTSSDELLVKVNKVANVKVRYIQLNESLFTMSDLDVAANRLLVSAKTVGEKDNGDNFGEADDSNIEWEIIDGKDVVKLNEVDYSKNPNAALPLAAMVSIGPLQPGTATVRLKHSQMPGYERRLYVNVVAHDYNFTVSTWFIDLMEGEESREFSWKINNVDSPDYSKVVLEWNTEDDGIKVVKGETSAWVQGLKKGSYIVKVIYGGVEHNINVEVSRMKLLEIHESYVMVVPGQRRVVDIKVEPPESEVTYRVDYDMHLNIARNPFVRDPDTGNIVGFEFEASDLTGVTKVYLKANGLERVFSVENTYNVAFYGSQRADIRGKPGDTVKFYFSILPKEDFVEFLTGNQSGPDQITSVPVIDNGASRPGGKVDGNSRFFNVDLLTCGIASLGFASDTNKQVGINLEVPVRVYYPEIKFEFAGTASKGENFPSGFGSFEPHSKIDQTNNVIYLAQGEVLTIFPVVTGYPGHDLQLTHVDAVGSETNTNETGRMFISANAAHRITVAANASNYPNGRNEAMGYVTLNTNADNIQRSTTGLDSLQSREYAGLLHIGYKHYTGGDHKNTGFKKTFIVYYERWYRK